MKHRTCLAVFRVPAAGPWGPPLYWVRNAKVLSHLKSSEITPFLTGIPVLSIPHTDPWWNCSSCHVLICICCRSSVGLLWHQTYLISTLTILSCQPESFFPDVRCTLRSDLPTVSSVYPREEKLLMEFSKIRQEANPKSSVFMYCFDSHFWVNISWSTDWHTQAANSPVYQWVKLCEHRA